MLSVHGGAEKGVGVTARTLEKTWYMPRRCRRPGAMAVPPALLLVPAFEDALFVPAVFGADELLPAVDCVPAGPFGSLSTATPPHATSPAPTTTTQGVLRIRIMPIHSILFRAIALHPRC